MTTMQVYDINRLQSKPAKPTADLSKLVAENKKDFAPIRAYDAPHTVTISLADWNAILSYLSDAAAWNESQGYDALARECTGFHARISKQCRTAIRAAFNEANSKENPDDGPRLSDRYMDDY